MTESMRQKTLRQKIKSAERLMEMRPHAFTKTEAILYFILDLVIELAKDMSGRRQWEDDLK